MIHNTGVFCEGCEQNCEYGYFTNPMTGAIMPTLGCHIVTDYWLSRSEHKVITPEDIQTREQAIEFAQTVASRCNHNYRNRRVK